MLDATWSSDGEAFALIDSIRMLAAVDEIGAESAKRVKAAMEGLAFAIVAHEYWDEARSELAPMTAGEPGPAPFRRPLPKVGRNQRCPCGSGKKYKRCCGMN